MSFASALTQALNIFSVVIDQALCIFGEKSAWGKKSAWEPDSQDPAYYAGLAPGMHGNQQVREVLKVNKVNKSHL